MPWNRRVATSTRTGPSLTKETVIMGDSLVRMKKPHLLAFYAARLRVFRYPVPRRKPPSSAAYTTVRRPIDFSLD
jgi:hypothetical protein